LELAERVAFLLGEIAMRVMTLPPRSGFRKKQLQDAKSQLLLSMNFLTWVAAVATLEEPIQLKQRPVKMDQVRKVGQL
jgi:hypothetical protein